MQVSMVVQENGSRHEFPVPQDKARKIVDHFKQQGMLVTNGPTESPLIPPTLNFSKSPEEVTANEACGCHSSGETPLVMPTL